MVTIELEEIEEIVLKNVLIERIGDFCYKHRLRCKPRAGLYKLNIIELINYLTDKYKTIQKKEAKNGKNKSL